MILHNGDIGTIIRVTIKDGGTAVDLRPATEGTGTVLTAHPPGAAAKSWQASYFSTGEDGILDYATQPGDIDTPGEWQIQALITFSETKILRSKPKIITVGPRLDSA